jgi:hypothetical protein
MKPLWAFRNVITRPQKLVVPRFFSKSSFGYSNKTDIGLKVGFNGFNSRFYSNERDGCSPTYIKLRTYVAAKNGFGGYKYYNELLSNPSVTLAEEEFLQMFKILADSPKNSVEETRRLIDAMESRKVAPTKDHLKQIIEVISSNFPTNSKGVKYYSLDSAYEFFQELRTKYNIKVESGVFSAYVEACLDNNDVDRALRFISATKDQDVVIMRQLYVQIVQCCLKNLMPSYVFFVIVLIV